MTDTGPETRVAMLAEYVALRNEIVGIEQQIIQGGALSLTLAGALLVWGFQQLSWVALLMACAVLVGGVWGITILAEMLVSLSAYIYEAIETHIEGLQWEHISRAADRPIGRAGRVRRSATPSLVIVYLVVVLCLLLLAGDFARGKDTYSFALVAILGVVLFVTALLTAVRGIRTNSRKYQDQVSQTWRMALGKNRA